MTVAFLIDAFTSKSMSNFIPILCSLLMMAPSDSNVQTHPQPTRWESPSHNYTVVISDGLDLSVLNPYRLSIYRGKTELAHYAFDDGKEPLQEVYWSPNESFVAFNDHYGHRAWRVWIVSLKDGSLVQKNGSQHSSDFDMYLNGDFPDVLELAQPEIASVYPGYARDEDKRGSGHITVIYGWMDDSTLRMFDEMVYDDLAEKENACLSIYSLLKVQNSGLSASHFHVTQTNLISFRGRPAEVEKILGF